MLKLKKELFEKVTNLNLSINTLKDNTKIESYFKAFEPYNEVVPIVIEIFKILFAFLFESILKSFINAISDNTESIQELEESKSSTKSIQILEEFYERSFSLISFNYLSGRKISNLESNIHDLYILAEENIQKANEYNKV